MESAGAATAESGSTSAGKTSVTGGPGAKYEVIREIGKGSFGRVF